MDPTALALRFRGVLLAGILGLVLLIPAAVIPWPGSAATCAAASTHRVAVVVQHLDGATLSRCVSFTTDSVTGEQALAGSKIEAGLLPSGGFGKAVCQLDYEPASYPDTCWTGTSPFWALFVAHGGGWQYSSVGISSVALHDGDALGFRYQSQSDHAPPAIAGDCPDPTPPPTPKPTPRPTAPPTPRPTTPIRTASPIPAGTGPAAPGAPSTLPESPVASGTDGGLAVGTGPQEPGPTPDPALTAAAPEPDGSSTVGAAGTALTSAGDAPVGLVFVAVAALAFAALGALQIRRPR